MHEMLPDGIRIGIAVSGGADSVALFRTLHALAAERQWTLVVLHVNHKLRGEESDEDARFVGQMAANLGSFCTIAELPLSGVGNLEQEARLARNAFFCESMHKHNLHKIAQGHTQSDQAETVLFRILRGSGSAGLSGIRPTTRDGFVRPLLKITRSETLEYLHNIAQPWREDSSNQSLAFDRNRIRLELLPTLAQTWNPQIETTLASLADWARAEEDYWDPVIASLAAQHFTHAQTDAQHAQLCTTRALTTLPLAAARRLVRHAIGLVRGDLQSIDFAHVEKILALAAQSEGSGRLQIPGVDVMRSFDWVRFAQPGTYARDRRTSSPVPIPGQIPLPGNLSRLLLQLRDSDCSYNSVVDCLDRDLLPASLELRTWQPGDQYRPLSHAAPVKHKTLFQEARIPLWDRNWWPVLAAGEEIVWTRQFGVAAQFAASQSTRSAVEVTEIA
jgi:tRNA(Ile)-lysidine synthase